MALQDLSLPRLGETMDSGRLVKWLKQPGEWCERGQSIVEFETDKTVVELPSLMSGRLVEILKHEGELVAVGVAIARMDVPDDLVATVAATPTIPPIGAEHQAPAVPADAASAAPPSVPVPPFHIQPSIRATPVARRLARSLGVSLDGVPGSGRRGRIEATDVPDAVSVGVDAAGVSHPADRRSGNLAWRSWAARGRARGTIVLLHGFAGDGQTWAVMGAHLSRAGHTVLAPDLPSHGQSIANADSLDDLLGPLQEWLNEVCSESHELVGHSMGAVAAVRLARLSGAAKPHRVTLFAPMGLGLEIDAAFVQGMAGVDNVATLRHLLRKLAVRPPCLSLGQESEMVAALGPRGRLNALAAAMVGGGHQRVDILPDLAALGQHARVVMGLEDRIVPWQHVLNLSAATAVHLVHQAGHMLHWDDPTSVAALFD